MLAALGVKPVQRLIIVPSGNGIAGDLAAGEHDRDIRNRCSKWVPNADFKAFFHFQLDHNFRWPIRGPFCGPGAIPKCTDTQYGCLRGLEGDFCNT